MKHHISRFRTESHRQSALFLCFTARAQSFRVRQYHQQLSHKQFYRPARAAALRLVDIASSLLSWSSSGRRARSFVQDELTGTPRSKIRLRRHPVALPSVACSIFRRWTIAGCFACPACREIASGTAQSAPQFPARPSVRFATYFAWSMFVRSRFASIRIEIGVGKHQVEQRLVSMCRENRFDCFILSPACASPDSLLCYVWRTLCRDTVHPWRDFWHELRETVTED